MTSGRCEPDGPEDAQIVVLTDRPAWADLNAGRFLTDHSGKLLWDSFRSGAGLLRSRVRVEAICPEETPGNDWRLMSRDEKSRHELDALGRLAKLRPNLVVTLGDWPLELLTGQKSSDKWHLSVLPQIVADRPKVLSVLHPERVFKEHKSAFYLRLASMRAQREALFPEIRRPLRTFHTQPTPAERGAFLRRAARASWLSVDIETGQGQITCIGFGSTPGEAMSVPTLRLNYDSDEAFHAAWSDIARALAGPARKVLQNGIYDLTYLSAYGIRVENFAHDTMIAQKVLYPEFSVGLDNIARIYTDEPYWKDDAKDWSARYDVNALYRYNCTDVCVTLAAAWAQRADLEKRGLTSYFAYLMRLASGPVLEMSWRGLPLDTAEMKRLHDLALERVEGLERALNAESEKLLQRETNPRSPLQVKTLLAAAGFKRLPFRDGKETSDKGALMKLRLKSPDSKLLAALIDISEAQKELSSYLRFEYDPDERLRYTLYATGTETHRMSCSKDPWNRGINAQTVPSHLKTMFRAPEGRTLIEVDLRQADARVVAWDAAEPTLMSFFEKGEDIHRYVASQPELFNCAPGEVTPEQRQLGKKVGHASNYGVSPPTLVESCLKEMNLVITERRAAQMLQGYFRTFPGITRWQERIREELSRTRTIRAPTGFSRIFHDRFGPELFREAYAFLPQHLVAFAINQLILRLNGQTRLLIQTHDSALIECDDSRLEETLALIKDEASWNPRFRLSGGELRIPIEIKAGRVWGEAQKIYES